MCVIQVQIDIYVWFNFFHQKSRLEQKVIALTKQITTATNNQIAQKRQSEKLLEQIRKLEEIEKSLSLQLVCICSSDKWRLLVPGINLFVSHI